MHCCICGGKDDVKYCKLCEHNFCGSHRSFWSAIGLWQRGAAAVKEYISVTGGNGWVGSGTPLCKGHPTPP